MEFERWFASEQSCLDYLCRIRWPGGFHCPRCRCIEAWIVSRGLYRCKRCDVQTSATAGTIFEGTRKPLQMWFRAMWHATNQKHGVSALGLQHALGLGSYNTAWQWMHKLRRAMVRPGRDRLSGVVEVDETFIGGKRGSSTGRTGVGGHCGPGRWTTHRGEFGWCECLTPRLQVYMQPSGNPSSQARPFARMIGVVTGHWAGKGTSIRPSGPSWRLWVRIPWLWWAALPPC